MHRIKKDAIFLVDGSSLLYRSYYGIRPLHTSAGIPTQATYGFCRAIKRLIDDFDPQHILIAWDSKGKTFRSDIFEAYKAHRQEPPSDLFIQKEQIIKFADTVEIAQISKTGYEADDLIYSIIQDHPEKNFVIIGPDKDLHQLICDRVMILDPMKKEVIDETVFKNRRGFDPTKLPFYHAIVGDSSDNIPGVKGIGKKGATDLVMQFESLEDLYENLDKITKERTKKLLTESKDSAFLSKTLFLLKHIKLSLTLKKISFDKQKWSQANDLFREFEFTSLVVPETKHTHKVTQTLKNKQEQQSSFLQTPSTQEAPEKQIKKRSWKCVIIRKEDELKKLIEKVKEKKVFALDTETTGLLPLQDKLVGLSIACDTKTAYYIPFSHTEDKQIDREKALELLKPIFTSRSIKKILQNTKFDQLALWHYGSQLNNVTFDTLVAANLLRTEWSKIGLKKLSLTYLNEPMDSFADVLGKDGGSYKTFAQVPIAQAAPYAAHDALQTLKLEKVLSKDLNKEKKLKTIFETVEMPLSQVLFDMEKTGIQLDTEPLDALNTIVTKKLKTIETKIFAAIEHNKITSLQDLNLNSPKQIEVLLFDELKLPVIKKSLKGKRSTDKEVLHELSKQHPIPGLIIKYRELFKLKSTYIEALPLTINPETNRIHTSFSQTMVATGRLSSSNPNLQNIPAGGEYGIKIREAFTAPRGSQFISADYSQIELRVLAHMTKDKNLCAAFLNDHDIHAQTASQLFNVPINKVTNEQRQIGKKINFSILYGQTPYGMAKELDIKHSEAKEYIEKYFDQYPGVSAWIEKTIEQAQKDGFVTTLMGRRRYVSGLREKNKTLYQAARRVAVNSPVQGTSAEIMKVAMLKVAQALQAQKLDSKIILQIHDELLIESPNSEIELVEKIVKKEMEDATLWVSACSWKIPLTVAIRHGINWAKITK